MSMGSAFSADLVRAVENPDVNRMLLEELGGFIKIAAEKVRGHEIVDVSTIGSYAPKHMVGQPLPYDESKPRASKGCQIQNSVSHHMQQGGTGVIEVLNHVTEEAGYKLGAHMNGNCAGCGALKTNVSAQYSMSRDSTEVRFSAICKHGSNPVCPDQMWSYAAGTASTGAGTTASLSSIEAFRREYMQDHSNHAADAMRYVTEQGFLNMNRKGYGALDLEPLPFAKPKEVVTDLDVEVEIRKLDENYGLF